MIIELVKVLEQRNRRVAVLTRGYKRRSNQDVILNIADKTCYNTQQIGDEPSLILHHLRNGILGVGANRYHLGCRILEKYPIEIFLLDDGFQHRKLHRNLDICLLDASQWPSHSFLFPLSYLRDFKSSLRRADLLILTKFEQFLQQTDTLKNVLEKKYQIPVFKGRYVLQAMVNLSTHEQVGLDQLKAEPVGAVCAIANAPYYFFFLSNNGFDIAYRKQFDDHHEYDIDEIKNLIVEAESVNAQRIIITEKDSVKLKSILKKNTKLLEKFLVTKTRFQIEDEHKFWKIIDQVIG